MGMDYRSVGSASYPRFNDELKGIVELFGGKMVTNRKPKEQCTMVEYFMEEPLRYEMPEGTPASVIKWVNNPYAEDFTAEETKEIYNFLKPKWNKVKAISGQIAEELRCCVYDETNWSIE